MSAARRVRSHVYAAAVRPSLGLLSAILVAAAVLAACGGGDKPPAIHSKADFVKAGDKICEDRDHDSAKFINSLGKDAEIAAISSGLADIYATTIAKTTKLALPPGPDRAGAQAYIKALMAESRPVTRWKAAAADFTKAVASKNLAAIKSTAGQLQIHTTTVQGLDSIVAQKASDYGLTRCANAPVTNPVA
jgi:hypothetical protein